MNLFSSKMTLVNIFGEVISSNKSIIVQREPPGIGFKYLDSTFGIGKKILVNVAKPEENFDAVNKEFFYKRYDFLHEIYERFQISFNNHITKLDDLKESYDNLL